MRPWKYRNLSIFNKNALPHGSTGFIYRITNNLNEHYYIGQKGLYFSKVKPPLKGRVNKRHSKIESDWLEYYGSSNNLLADIEKHGIMHFRREILSCHNNKHDLSYAEAEMQFKLDVLKDDMSYNQLINCRLRKR